MRSVYDCPDAVAAFVAATIPCRGWVGKFKAIGFAGPEGLVAGVVYHGWEPEAGVIELSAASTRRDWLTKARLREVFGYPFEQLGCQLCVARIAESNARTRRIWRALGATEHIIPRLRGRNEAEVVATLTVDAWRERFGRL